MKFQLILLFILSNGIVFSAKSDTGVVYDFVEVMPEYPGGEDALIEFLQENIRYPKYAIQNEIEGQVQIEYTINEDGSVSNFKPLKYPDSSLMLEGIRVLKLMPPWKPGNIKGENVKVHYIVPINFKLEDVISNDDIAKNKKRNLSELKPLLPTLYVLLFIILFITYRLIKKFYFTDNS